MPSKRNKAGLERPADRTQIIGRYDLIEELAIGGMAKLYLARAQGLADFSKPVVLKRILPQYATDPTFVEMFLDEARLAAMLHHPNIVQIYDIGRLSNEYFFTMEYVRGESLSRLMQELADTQQRLPIEHAIAIAIGVAAGLHYAHEKADDDGVPMNIVHRDVAPSNVLISHNGGVKLVDFGIAKAATRHHVTEVGTLKGRIAYMSPEQSIGSPIDSRSDIYAIGIILYEMITGTRMYGDANQLAILHALANADVEPPSSRWSGCPPELERIVMRALDKDVDQRYQTAGELQYDLESFAHTHGLFLSSVRLSQFMANMFEIQPSLEQSQSAGRMRRPSQENAEIFDSSETKFIASSTPTPGSISGFYNESASESSPSITIKKRGLALWQVIALAFFAGTTAFLAATYLSSNEATTTEPTIPAAAAVDETPAPPAPPEPDKQVEAVATVDDAPAEPEPEPEPDVEMEPEPDKDTAAAASDVEPAAPAEQRQRTKRPRSRNKRVIRKRPDRKKADSADDKKVVKETPVNKDKPKKDELDTIFLPH